MHLETVVIGTGLSSLSFIDKFLEKHKKIDVISPDVQTKETENILNKHLFDDLPYQIISQINKIKNYFEINNILVNPNSKILGSLEFGGLSNYWGLQIDKNIFTDIEFLKKKTRSEIIQSFFEILEKLKLLGEFKYKNKKYSNDYKIDNFFKKIYEKKYTDFLSSKPILAFSKKKKLTPNLYLKNYIKKKSIKIHNFSVQEIFYKKGIVELKCLDKNKIKRTIFAKKVIFGCGTIVTTKLILKFLKIKNEVKIKHHPRLVSVFFSKRKIKNTNYLNAAQLHMRSKSKKNSFIVDFRTGTQTIVDSAVKLKTYLMPIKFILNYFKNFLVFSNILLDSSFSNLFIRINKNKTLIYSKKSNLIESLDKVHFKVFNLLKKENLIMPFSKNFFPGYGNDFHYFGSIPISNKKNKLSVNENCQLNGYKNIFIIDGSVIDFKSNKYPLGLIMANARRVAKHIK